MIILPRWNKFDGPTFRWVHTFCTKVAVEPLPRLTGSTIYITSDYSDRPGSKFEVISLLLADLDTSHHWQIARRIIRTDYLKDNRTISFKKLNDHRRREALIPFLSAADSIEGICVTIAIHKDIKDLCTNGGVLDELTKSLPLQGKWNKKSFEKMIRVAYFVSLFVAGLSKRGQDIYWISDEDEIFSNQHRASDVARIVSGFTSIYVKHKLGNLGVGTVKLDEGDHLEEDFASIPDLAAGAVCEIILALDKATKGRFTYEGIAHPIPYNISSKANIISSWLDDNTLPLKRLNMIFDIRDKGYSIGSYRLSL